MFDLLDQLHGTILGLLLWSFAANGFRLAEQLAVAYCLYPHSPILSKETIFPFSYFIIRRSRMNLTNKHSSQVEKLKSKVFQIMFFFIVLVKGAFFFKAICLYLLSSITDWCLWLIILLGAAEKAIFFLRFSLFSCTFPVPSIWPPTFLVWIMLPETLAFPSHLLPMKFLLTRRSQDFQNGKTNPQSLIS